MVPGFYVAIDIQPTSLEWGIIPEEYNSIGSWPMNGYTLLTDNSAVQRCIMKSEIRTSQVPGASSDYAMTL